MLIGVNNEVCVVLVQFMLVFENEFVYGKLTIYGARVRKKT